MLLKSFTSIISQEGYGLFLAAISAIVLIWLTPRLCSSRLDRKEPPEVRSYIPYIGHLLGIIRYEAEYFQRISARANSPIFTLKILSARIYVISSPELVQSVFRNAVDFSFEPIFVGASRRVFHIPESAMKLIMQSHRDGKDAGLQIVKELQRVMHRMLAAGKPLLEMNAHILSESSSFLHEIDSIHYETNLYRWVRHTFTIASALVFYGKESPVSKDTSLIDAAWDFIDKLGLLFLDVFPAITAAKGYRARERFSNAFRQYYRAHLDEGASDVIKGRRDVFVKYGLSRDLLATWEFGMLGNIMNTIPGAFWLICHIFSDNLLLSAVRKEIETIISQTYDRHGRVEATLDVTLLYEKCPLLVSAWQETLRTKNVAVANRVVMRDTRLEDGYLLKKGSFIQMPAVAMHTSQDIWGLDAHQFKADRFLKRNVAANPRDQRTAQRQGFIPWGGGVVLCPGRYFASTGILGVVATLALGYDIKMADAPQTLKLPRVKRQGMSNQILQPGEDLDVVISRRKEFSGVRWRYHVGGDLSPANADA